MMRRSVVAEDGHMKSGGHIPTLLYYSFSLEILSYSPDTMRWAVIICENKKLSCTKQIPVSIE